MQQGGFAQKKMKQQLIERYAKLNCIENNIRHDQNSYVAETFRPMFIDQSLIQDNETSGQELDNLIINQIREQKKSRVLSAQERVKHQLERAKNTFEQEVQSDVESEYTSPKQYIAFYVDERDSVLMQQLESLQIKK